MGNKQTKDKIGAPTKSNSVSNSASISPSTATPKTTLKDSNPGARYHLTAEQYNQHYQGWIALAANGRIARANFITMMTASGGIDKEMAEILFDTYDADGSGDIDVDEFLGLCALSINGTEEEQIRASFRAFDKNKDGKLSKDELRLRIRTLIRTKKYATGISTEDSDRVNADVDKVLDELFDMMDTDKSGFIDVEEYVKGFSGNPKVIQFIEDIRS